MLKLYNKEHVAVSALTNLKDYKIEYLLSGEDFLEFSLSICDEDIHLVEEEGYVRNKLNEYVIKAIDPGQNFKRFSCVVNVEDIKSKSIKSFDTSNNNITETIRLAIAGTGWILADNNITKRRTVRVQNTNALEVLREVRKVFNVDFRFDAINKVINVYESFGSDKGVYFSDELNLKSLSIPSDTYDYATRIYPYGKDGLNIAAINSGKEYVENYQYTNKVIEVIWEDNRYTVVESLKEDAEVKLEELSKPKRSYQASISDLAKQSNEYEFLDFFLGDTITLLSKQEKFRDKQRIVKYIQYPNNPSSNTCELGNTQLTFEDLQKENEAKNNIVDNITSDNGTVDGSKVDNITTEQISNFKASVAEITDLTVINAEITNLKAHNVTITGELNAVKVNIGTLTVNVGIIDSLTVTHTAQINDLKANSATITQLNAVNATIGILEAEVGKINTLVNGNLSSENIQAGGITSDCLTIKNGFITNAMIANLDVSKVNAGDISTNKFKIKSDDGGIEIVGATQQFKDKNSRVRLQMGKDTKGDFNFIIRGEDGTTTLIDHTGVKAGAIADDLIVSDMIAGDSIGEKQINYSSFATGFNKDNNTSTIKSTKIMLNNQNQTLELAFNELKTQADGTRSITESHSTTIGVMQGQITTAINNTQIVKDGQTILLKDDYNRTVATVDSMKSTIGSHATTIDQHTGKITGVETRVNVVERDLSSITARVSSTETITSSLDKKIDGNVAEISTTKSKVSIIETNLTSITSRVSTVENTQTTVNGKVIALETWKKEAEIKITDASIISTVSSQFYNKGETDNKFTTQTQFTQTVNSFNFSLQNNSKNNVIKNGRFKAGIQYWNKGNANDFIETYGDFMSLEIKEQNRWGAYTSDVVGCEENTLYTLYAHIANETIEYTDYANVNVICKVIYLNSSDNIISTQDLITRTWQVGWSDNDINNVTFTTPKNCTRIKIEYAGSYTNVPSRVRFKIYSKGFCITKGNNQGYFPSTDEIYSENVLIDTNGVTVKHKTGAYSIFNSEGSNFYSSDGTDMTSLRNGGVIGYHAPTNEMIGHIFPTHKNNGDLRMNGWSISNSILGDYIAIAKSNNNEESGFTLDDIIICYTNDVEHLGGLPKGTYFQLLDVNFDTRAFFNNHIHIQNKALMFNSRDYNYKNEIVANANNNNDFEVHGCDSLTLGIRHGYDKKPAITIIKDINTQARCIGKFECDFDLTGKLIYNGTFSGKFINSYSANDPIATELLTFNFAKIGNNENVIEVDNTEFTRNIYMRNKELGEENILLNESQVLQDENISFTEDALNCIIMGTTSTYSRTRSGGINSMASYLGNQIYKGKLEYYDVIIKYPGLKIEIDMFLENKIKNDGLKLK